MMNTQDLYRRLAFQLFAVLIVVSAALKANATIADLEALQQSNANLEFQYGFEGADDSTRLADGSGNGWGLEYALGNIAGSPGDVGFIPGFDATSQAFEPLSSPATREAGAALKTISDQIPIANGATVEAVISLDSFTSPPDASFGAYILDAWPGIDNGDRVAFFLRQLNPQGGGDSIVTSFFGDTTGFGDHSREPAALTYNAGDWYYIAVTASHDGGTNQVTTTWSTANLSAGETSLTTATDSSTFTGPFDGPAVFGLGVFLNGRQEFLDGRIDTIALTNEVLSTSDLQARLDSIYAIPEPTSLALFGLGGLALLSRRRSVPH